MSLVAGCSPPPKTPPAFPAASIAAGGAHTCSIGPAGGVACAGKNNYGQLGDGTTSTRYNPVAVPGLTGVVQVTAGGGHTCALTKDRQVFCWGENSSGQLGDGTTINRSSPVKVEGVYDVSSIAAGLNRTCALLSDGAASCWGDDTNGALGDGGTQNSSTPVRVHGLKDAVLMAVGGDHACAVLADGEAACWGGNGHGALGDGTTQPRSAPGRVPGLSHVRDIAAGYQFTCAVRAEGDVQCWGFNARGGLGDGATTDGLVPGPAKGIENAAAVTAGLQHACARLANGGLACWGSNSQGDVGDGTTTDRLTPTPVVGLTQVVAAAAGSSHTCAVQLGGAIYCWGNNAQGQLGIGSTLSQKLPVQDSPVPDWMVDITGNPLQVTLNYPNPYSSVERSHAPDQKTPILTAFLQAPLPGVGGNLHNTPFNGLLDYNWSVAPAPSGSGTLQQQASAQFAQLTCQQVNSAGFSCSNVVVHLPSTGALGAEAGPCQTGGLTNPQTGGGGLVLQYILTGGEIDFTSDAGTTWKVPVGIFITYGARCAADPCSFLDDGPAFAEIDTDSPQPTNLQAGAAQFLVDLFFQLFLDQPSPLQQPQGISESLNFNAIDTVLNGFAQVCRAEERGDGFTSFSLNADPNAHTLSFVLTHPVDAAPTLYNLATQPNLLGASISASSVQVSPGTTIDVTGFGFPPNQSTDIALGWWDVLSGGLQYSVVGSLLIQPPNFIPTAGLAPTSGGSYVFTGLQPGTIGTFNVSECDPITCTPWSSPLTIATAGSASLVGLALDTTSNVIQTVTPDPQGKISTPLTIPPGTSPGAHTLMAVVGGSSVASLTIFVPGAGAPPFIEVLANGGEVSQSGSTIAGVVINGQALTVSVQFFPAGDTVTITLNGSGPPLATQPASSPSSSIVVPLGAPRGNQSIVASGSPSGETTSAPIFVQTPAQ